MRLGRKPRSDADDGASSDLASLALGPRDLPGYRVSIDRPQPSDKLAPGASAGHVRAWNGGVGGQTLVAVTIEQFGGVSAAKRFARREHRGARGVTGNFPVPAVRGAVGVSLRKPGGMPDGRDGYGNVVVFVVGSLGVVLSHLGSSQQSPELIAGLAQKQYVRLTSPNRR